MLRPVTAGRGQTAIEFVRDRFPVSVDVIEAAAVAAERARLREAVAALDNCDQDPKYDTVARAAVLALLEPEAPQ